MKLRLTIIIIFSFFSYSFLQAQTIEETYNFANQQFDNEKYTQALVEFQRVAFFDSGDNYNEVYQKIGDSFFALGNYEMAIQNFNIAIRLAENDSLKTELIFKKVICYFNQKNFFYALNELFVISEPVSEYLTNKLNLFLATSYYGINDYNNAMLHFSKLIPQKINPELEEIFLDFEKFRKRFDPDKIQTLSMFFPGLGQFYIGNVAQGINSIVLIGGIVVATVFTWQSYGFLNALLSTSSWYYRYYTGGYKSVRNIAIHKIEHKKELVFHSILYYVEENIGAKK